MRHWWQGVVVVALASGLLAGCGGGTGSGGVFEVSLTDEDLQTVQGNRCAVKGNATNIGNLTAKVDLTYEALSATGAVIGISTASFEVTGFSNFQFSNSKTNDTGQPSSTLFTNGLACAGISRFKRSETKITKA